MIREMIAGVENISWITECMLRYTDLIPVGEGKTRLGTGDIAHLLSGRFDCYTTQNKIVLVSTNIPGTAGSVCSIPNRPGKSGWPLVFTMYTEGPASFISRNSVVDWFDVSGNAKENAIPEVRLY